MCFRSRRVPAIAMYFAARRTSRTGSENLALHCSGHLGHRLVDIWKKGCFSHSSIVASFLSSYPPRVHIIRIHMSTTFRLPCSSQYSFPFRIRIRTIYAPLIPSASTRSNSSHLKTRRYLHLTLASLEPVLRIVINFLDTIGLMTVLCPLLCPLYIVSTRSPFTIATLRNLSSRFSPHDHRHRATLSHLAPILGFLIFIHCCHTIHFDCAVTSSAQHWIPNTG